MLNPSPPAFKLVIKKDVEWMQEDYYYPHSLIQDVLWGGLYHFGEPILKQWPVSKIRERAVKKAIEIIHWEDENSRYLTPGCVEKVSPCL